MPLFLRKAVFQGIFESESGPLRHSGNGSLRSENVNFGHPAILENGPSKRPIKRSMNKNRIAENLEEWPKMGSLPLSVFSYLFPIPRTYSDTVSGQRGLKARLWRKVPGAPSHSNAAPDERLSSRHCRDGGRKSAAAIRTLFDSFDATYSATFPLSEFSSGPPLQMVKLMAEQR